MAEGLRKSCSCEKLRSGRFKKWGEGHGGVIARGANAKTKLQLGDVEP